MSTSTLLILVTTGLTQTEEPNSFLKTVPMWISDHSRVTANAIKRSQEDPKGVYIVVGTSYNFYFANTLKLYRFSHSHGGYIKTPMKIYQAGQEVVLPESTGNTLEEIRKWNDQVIAMLSKMNKHHTVFYGLRGYNQDSRFSSQMPGWSGLITGVISNSVAIKYWLAKEGLSPLVQSSYKNSYLSLTYRDGGEEEFVQYYTGKGIQITKEEMEQVEQENLNSYNDRMARKSQGLVGDLPWDLASSHILRTLENEPNLNKLIQAIGKDARHLSLLVYQGVIKTSHELKTNIPEDVKAKLEKVSELYLQILEVLEGE